MGPIRSQNGSSLHRPFLARRGEHAVNVQASMLNLTRGDLTHEHLDIDRHRRSSRRATYVSHPIC